MGTVLGLHRSLAASATFVGSAQREGYGSQRVVLCQLCMEIGDGRVFARYFMRRSTALEAELHSAFGRAETAMVLAGIGTLKAGAKLHGTDNDGYGSARGAYRCFGQRAEKALCSRAVGVHGLCRFNALHAVSVNGLTETAKALIGAGADVHCKERTKGYALG